jgi:inner membrane protein
VPSAISHAAVAVAAGLGCAPRDVPSHFLSLSIICSVLPDADVIGFSFGVPYGHFLGHRGFFHSPSFALFLSFFVVGVFFRSVDLFSGRWFFYIVYFFLLSASHGILDGFTSGGLGIAFLAPFDNKRFFFPWTPIMVSPIGIRAFFSKLGLMVFKSELLWVWLPCFLMVLVAKIARALLVRH